eukprot:1275629-Rhodomonas_salina.1
MSHSTLAPTCRSPSTLARTCQSPVHVIRRAARHVSKADCEHVMRVHVQGRKEKGGGVLHCGEEVRSGGGEG